MSTPADLTGSGTRRTLWQRIRGRQGRNLWFALFVAPFLVGLLVFVYIPIVWSAYLSFFDARATIRPTRFVGLANYQYLLGDQLFRDSMLTFIVFAIVIVPLTYACSLALALMLDNVGRFRAFFRSVFFIPTACSYVVASMVWRLSFFNGARFGFMNSLLRRLGLDDVDWLGGTNNWYWVALVTLRLWLQVGYYMILLIAGLNQIPTDTYEAAAIDGASGWRRLRYITLPQLRATSAAVLMLLLIGAFQAFDEFYNMMSTAGSYPPYARPPLVHLYMISVGGSQQDLGLGGAGTMILTAIIVVFGVLQNWWVTRADRSRA
ncbi:carbohydrate ABC transporter permease [Acidipropionibacterium acidipropionici]|uniref:ABC transporter permease n=2 Tax=Acidipropionibacterium acidipropionici TaxID=1748 RepID=A0AAC9FBN3_9ACTN|nr:sugar ABC transporter permease [Acidipropionibacterium acidipropionici]AFV89219.1 ABC transporter, permease protein [Acidipropionibacterium acidipropionici ATCC 4875]AMS04226.1 ABC transporter permease [Acidipropionibacterium acidipropionici]AOZ45718.1 ABC transporter permease [Acidipropionibacterium acidipropionici]